MGGPERQNKSVAPPEEAAVLMGDPLPELTAQDFADRLGKDPSDHDLAEAIALTWSKTGHLMYLTEEDESFAGELDEWFDLEKKLCQQAVEIHASKGHAVVRAHGLFEAIEPFMERNGYRGACGWWVRVEESANRDAEDGRCPECGADLEDFVEGSSMGQRCPACDWSVATTYMPPILEDEREYSIILMPDVVPTKEALGAISSIAMCSYVAAKQLMEHAPTTLFAGRATEVLARKNELEGAGVSFEVWPDFPYDKDGHLESDARLNTLLLQTFPELTGQFEEYTSWQDGMETGCFLTYEDLLLPIARHALDEHDEAFLARLGAFIERLMTSGDDRTVNVATVGLIEGLKAYGNTLIRAFLGPVSLEEFDTLVY